jgi:glyoxylase-like metal-dependent hydrolase (beta-lactamase superfamily II)/rhodanese-related sulfurtransferase
MPHDRVIPVVDEGLGNSSYLVDLGDGRALAIDPSRDLRLLDRSATQRGLSVAAAAETHLHADFVSGSTRLAARDGASVFGAAAGHREFPHTPLDDGDEVDLGGLTLRAWTTPGHTAEHLAYLLVDNERVLAVFTGGSLIVGAAARTDLAGAEQTEPLARAQFRSLRRLTELPDDTPVYPTHGAGSFCAAPPGADRVTTIGREKAANSLLRIDDEDTFVDTLLAGLGTFPPYFLRLGELNRRGPALPAEAGLRALSVASVLALRGAGAEIIDVRAFADYAAAHIPGSLAIELRPAFATWLGWLVPNPQTPLVVVRAPDQDPGEVLWQARKIGYDNLAGELDGGVTAWQAAGQPLATTALISPEHVERRRLLDIRQAAEYAGGHVPHARHVELGALADADIAPGPLVMMCGHGERAATAASVLERAGRGDLGVLLGGPGDWAHATGRRLEASG